MLPLCLQTKFVLRVGGGCSDANTYHKLTFAIAEPKPEALDTIDR